MYTQHYNVESDIATARSDCEWCRFVWRIFSKPKNCDYLVCWVDVIVVICMFYFASVHWTRVQTHKHSGVSIHRHIYHIGIHTQREKYERMQVSVYIRIRAHKHTRRYMHTIRKLVHSKHMDEFEMWAYPLLRDWCDLGLLCVCMCTVGPNNIHTFSDPFSIESPEYTALRQYSFRYSLFDDRFLLCTGFDGIHMHAHLRLYRHTHTHIK